MKFLCEHCKAKYQIADEKVAGRTVRMKCRKCGNSIEVRASVTETSVSTKFPTAGSEPPRAGYPAASSEPEPKPARPARPLATSLSSAMKPATSTRPGAAPRSADQGSLAGAFQRNVQAKDDEISVALDLRELSAAEEWYVAINGVPVGPVRVAELRRKATLGVVTEESLCWQEGMEEWRPVRAVAELASLVREAAADGRVSLVTPPPPEAHPPSSGRPGSMRPSMSASLAARPPKPAPAPAPVPGPLAPAQRSNVVPIHSRLATAEKLHEEPRPLAAPSAPLPPAAMVAADPFAARPLPSPFLSAGPPAATPGMAQPSAAPQPVVAPATVALPATPSLFVPAELELGLQKKSPPWILIAMFVLAAAFGITAAVIVFKPAPQVVVQVPTAAVAAPPPSAGATSTAASSSSDVPATAAAEGRTPKVASAARSSAPSSGAKTTAANTPATDPALRDLIAGAGGGAGPSAGPGSGEPGGSGGAQLTEDQVRSVLAMHTAGVKRTCWERVQTQSSSVNVTVHIVAGGNGQVSSATATGNDPVVAHCIEGEVRRWMFPGSGTIDIPFHFLRQ